MRKLTSHIIILLSAVVVLTLGSCASRKKVVIAPQPKQFEWLTAHVDIEAEMKGTSYTNLTGQVRMRRDSLLWASVSTFGVEVMRMKMTNDSVWVINRMEKTYLAEPLTSVADCFDLPISLPLVQNMLLGNLNGDAPEENKVVELKREELSGISAQMKYSDLKLNEPITFPCKITSKMERLSLERRKENQP